MSLEVSLGIKNRARNKKLAYQIWSWIFLICNTPELVTWASCLAACPVLRKEKPILVINHDPTKKRTFWLEKNQRWKSLALKLRILLFVMYVHVSTCTYTFHEILKARLGHLRLFCIEKRVFSATSMADKAQWPIGLSLSSLCY